MASKGNGAAVEGYQAFLQRFDRPGWKQFALAMGALVLAFLLAIYSSIFAQQGRVGATALAASLALVLSAYVAFTAVPYLARRTRMEWLGISLDYRLTPEGVVFIALILLLAIAGLNTGNNLLYMVMASLMAAILMSGVVSLAVLLGVDLELIVPEHVFARRAVPARVLLRNQKKFVPSFSLTLSGAEIDKSKRGSRRAQAANAKPAAGPDRRILRRSLYFPFLPAGRALKRPVELQFPIRGLYQEEGFTLSTRFPFGFLEKRLRLPLARRIWVYPAVEPTEEFFEILPNLVGELESYQRGLGHDLYSIRAMTAGDTARHVDWKATARTGNLKVREFAREDERRLQLVLDRRIGPPTPEALERFEAAVEFCACLAWHFSEMDAQLEFVCDGYQTPAARGHEIIYEILRVLAAIEPSAEPPLAPPLLTSENDAFSVICTAAPRDSVVGALSSRCHFVFFDTFSSRPESEPETAQQPVGSSSSAGSAGNKAGRNPPGK